MAVATLLLRGAAGDEGPLDGSLGGLGEGKGPCDLEHTINTITRVCVCGFLAINQLFNLASPTAQTFSCKFP